MKITTFLFLISLAAFSSLSAQTIERTERTRQFIVMGYGGIQLELTSRKGPYLRTLFDLLNTAPDAEEKTTAQLKTWLSAYPNIMDFADHVVQLQTEEEKNRLVAPLAPPRGPGIYSGDKLIPALEHLTRGMSVTVHLKTGEKMQATFEEYASKRLWLRGAQRRSVSLDDILAIEAPAL